MITRNIPSTGEPLPVMGLGTWQTFDVEAISPKLPKVLDELYAGGGRVIDSSPMYGKAEKIIGEITTNSAHRDNFFYATKVWISGKQEGLKQIDSSFKKMNRKVIDLVQVHNLLDWKTHLQTLRTMKDEGRIRYIGLTHYLDSAHAELEALMRSEPLDFVQFNYSIDDIQVENRLIPAAAELGVATIVNRPFGEGKIFRKVEGKPLPTWAAELGIGSWASFFLKFIIGHPGVTCVIPATADPEHAKENCLAATGEPLSAMDRKKMLDYFKML